MKNFFLITVLMLFQALNSQTLPMAGGQVVNPGLVTAMIPFDPAGKGYITSPFGFTNYLGSQLASGTYKIWAPPGQSISQINKVVVVVEGFDAKNNLDNDGIKNLMSPLDSYVLNTLNSHLITINFSDSHDFIERNAMFLVEFIKQLNNTKVGNEEIVLMGASMGGLVCRKALTFMENNGIDHECRLYVAIDSPNRGANAPFSVMELLYDLNGNSNTNSGTLDTTIDILNSPASTQLLRHLIEPALLSPPPSVNPNCTNFFQSLMTSNGCNRGYPSNCKNYGVSLGSLNGTGQVDNNNNPISPGAKLGDFNVSTNIAFGGVGTPLNYNLYGEVHATSTNSGSQLSSKLVTNHSNKLPQVTHNRIGSIPIDNAPGGFQTIVNDFISGVVNTTNSRPHNFLGKHNQTSLFFSNGNATGGYYADNTCFIPVISALDYNTTNLFYNISTDITNNTYLNNTPFDGICTFVSSSNGYHIDNIDPNIVSDVQQELFNAFSNPYKVCGSFSHTFSGLNIQGRFFKKAQSTITLGTNFSLANTSKFEFKAGDIIEVLDGTSINFGGEGALFIEQCSSPKACNFSMSGFRTANREPDDFMKFTAETYTVESNQQNTSGRCVSKVIQNDSVYISEIDCSNRQQKFFNSENMSHNFVGSSTSSMVNLVPNPNKGVFNLIYPSELKNAYLSIIDCLSREVYSSTVSGSKVLIDVNHLQPGVYFLILKTKPYDNKPIKFVVE